MNSFPPGMVENSGGKEETKDQVISHKHSHRERNSNHHPFKPTDGSTSQICTHSDRQGVVRQAGNSAISSGLRGAKRSQRKESAQGAPPSLPLFTLHPAQESNYGHTNGDHHRHGGRIRDKHGHQGRDQHVHEGQSVSCLGYPPEAEQSKAESLCQTMFLHRPAKHHRSKDPKEDVLSVKGRGFSCPHDTQKGKDRQWQQRCDGPRNRLGHPPDGTPNESCQHQPALRGKLIAYKEVNDEK